MDIQAVSRSEEQGINSNSNNIQTAIKSGGLLGRLFQLLEPWYGVFRQKTTCESARDTLLGAMLSPERATHTGSAIYRGVADRDQSRHIRVFSRSPWDLKDLARVNIVAGAEEFGTTDPIDVALDETHLKKVGHKIFGAGYGYDPQLPKWLKQKFSWMLRAVHGTYILEDPKYRRHLAMTIWFDILVCKLKRGENLTKEETDYLDAIERPDSAMGKSIAFVQFLRKTLDESGHSDQVLRLFADGSFSNSTFIEGLPHNTIYVGRLRKNAGLRAPLKDRNGKQFYGDELPTPEDMLDDDINFQPKKGEFYFGGGWSHFKFKDVNNIYWEKGTKKLPIRVLLLDPIPRNGPGGKKASCSEPAYLITTDLVTPARELIQGYLHRWQIEVTHREMKCDVGVGDMQGWTEFSVRRFHGALALMYGLVSLAAHRLFRSKQAYLSPLPLWRRTSIPRRPSTRSLIIMLREEVERFSIFDRSSLRKKLPKTWKLAVQHSLVAS